MDFSNLDNDNILVYALKMYNNPTCHSHDEFIEDLDRIKYLKRLFKRYQSKGILKDRLILNHLIILYNVFGVEPCTRLMFLRIEQDLWPILKTFLVFLNYQPEVVLGIEGRNIISSDITMDQGLINKLRKI